MSHRLVIAAAAVLALAGCLRRTSYTSCKGDGDCAAAGAGARCEQNGACSVPDSTCASGRRYHSSAPSGGDCVPGAPLPDSGTDAAPIAPGRECIQGTPLPTGYSACAAMVDAKEARCGTEMWDNVCVAIAEQTCALPCSQMAFVGANNLPFVIRLSDDAVIWRDPNTNAGDGGSAGAWADYDNDGDPDLATSGENLIRIFKNDGWDAGSSTLSLDQIFSVTWPGSPGSPWLNASDVRWVDYDHDGDLDLAVGGDDALILIRNDGGDVFIQVDPPVMRTSAAVDGAPLKPMVIRMAFGDYDKDGWPDLAVARFGHPIMIWHNDHGTFTDTNWMPTSVGFNSEFGGGVEWCNVDTDPEPELAASGYNYVVLADNTGGTMANMLTPLDATGAASDVHCADLDGDGDLDLIVSGGNVDPARIFRNGARTVNGFAQTWMDTTTPTGQDDTYNGWVGDLDGDHKLDFVQAGYNGATSINFQRFLNATTMANKPVMSNTLPARDVFPAEQQGQHSMSLAPLVGH